MQLDHSKGQNTPIPPHLLPQATPEQPKDQETKRVHWNTNIPQEKKTYTKTDKKLWMYISNVELPGGKPGWKPVHDSW